MDPLTQGLLGAAAAQAVLGTRAPRRVFLAGLLGGWLPDLDILIRSATDPLVGIVYHRHFTHSVFFVPIGAAIVAGAMAAVPRWRADWRTVYTAALLGVASHAPLDALTSYGTLLWWPLSNTRVAWDALPIIDFIFTPILLLGVIAALWTRRATAARVALAAAAVYTAWGFVQNHRALGALDRMARADGATITARRAMPQPGLPVVWRLVWRDETTIHYGVARTPLLGAVVSRRGGGVPIARADDLPAPWNEDPARRRAFETFDWFTDGFSGWVADAEGPVQGDFRYAPLGDGVPMWGLQFTSDGEPPWRRWSGPSRGELARRQWNALRGRLPELRAADETTTPKTAAEPEPRDPDR
jgi:inner membrane protein